MISTLNRRSAKVKPRSATNITANNKPVDSIQTIAMPLPGIAHVISALDNSVC